MSAGGAPTVTKIEVHYRRPIKLGDIVVGSAWCSGLISRKITVDYEFYVEGNVLPMANNQAV